jgi:hypothetical protein
MTLNFNNNYVQHNLQKVNNVKVDYLYQLYSLSSWQCYGLLQEVALLY